MRRIKVYSDGLVKLWEKYFINDTAKFIKSTHLERDDLGRNFTEKNGTEWTVLGAMEGNEIVCRNVENREVWAISRWKVSSLLYPVKHTEWKKEVKEKAKAEAKAKKAAKVVKTVTTVEEIPLSFIPGAVIVQEDEVLEQDETSPIDEVTNLDVPNDEDEEPFGEETITENE